MGSDRTKPKSGRKHTARRWTEPKHEQIRHFKKVHRILTFGLAYKPIAVPRTGPPAYSDVYMMTSLAHIPWEYPFMYLNPSEFSMLPEGSKVKRVK